MLLPRVLRAAATEHVESNVDPVAIMAGKLLCVHSENSVSDSRKTWPATLLGSTHVYALLPDDGIWSQ